MKLSLLSATILACAALGRAQFDGPQPFDCQPGQECWPSDEEWAQFNASIDGRLHATVPWAAPCFPTHDEYNQERCDQITSAYTVGVERAKVYGAMEAIQYEACGDQDCQLVSIAPGLRPIARTCSLGRLSAYHVDVGDHTHVSETLQFVRKHGIRVTIKNTGHDYLGRSSAPNTLALWVRNLRNLEYHQTFTADRCPSVKLENVGTMGAGVTAEEAYEFFEKFGMNVAGGNAASVGLAGGYGQAGGHGVFGPLYGLMVDQAVEFDVVTADGQFRTINECNDPDLFWAMRGGGGGAFAVLLAYRFRLYPAQPIHMHVLRANYSIIGESFTNSSIVRGMLAAHISNQTLWSDNNVSGRYYYGANQATLLTILPKEDDGSTLKNLTAAWRAGLQSIDGLNISEDEYYSFDSYMAYDARAQEIAAVLTPNGFAANVASRLIPRHTFENQPQELLEASLEGMDLAFSVLTVLRPLTSLEVLMTTPVHHPDEHRRTSANPAWRGALWHAIFLGGWVKGYPNQSQQDVVKKVYDAAGPIRDLTPGGGSYGNEDSVLIENWEETFFGDNYPRLLEIKGKYDPSHLFDCFKCVGWRGGSDFAYSCQGSDPSGATVQA